MKLSIGMIVKNEEKSLRSCLEALASLRAHVPSELIITDTGSTDGTREIASQYADILLDFEWCDDFSAARNTALDYASGDWFMYLDADEIFESTAEIENFFLSGEYENYKSASFVIRNYSNFQHTDYTDFHAMRVFDLKCPNSRFRGVIHEAIPFNKPAKVFSDYAHHDGYIPNGKAAEKNKHDRNVKLLEKELENSPEDTRILAHLAREYPPALHPEKVLDYTGRGIRAIQKKYQQLINKDVSFRLKKQSEIDYQFYSLYQQNALALHALKRWDDLIRLFQQYQKGKHEVNYVDIDIYYLLGAAYQAKENYSAAIEAYQNFIELFKRNQNNGFDSDDLFFVFVFHVKDKDLQSGLVNIIKCCIGDEKYEDALFYLDQLPVNPKYLSTAFDLMEQSGNYSYAGNLLTKFDSLNEPKKLEEALYAIENYYIHHSGCRESLSDALSHYPGDPMHYISLHHLRLSYQNLLVDEYRDILAALMAVNPFPKLLTDTIYYAMKSGIDIAPLFLSLPIDDLKFYVADIRNAHTDFSDVTADYFQSHCYDGNTIGLFWSIIFKEYVILNGTLSHDKMRRIILQYIADDIRYTHQVYSRDFLTEDKIFALPAPARFAFYMEKVNMAEEDGNEIAYARYMAKAIDSYKVMAGPVAYLSKEHRERLLQKKKQTEMDSAEMNLLTQQVKAQIYTFMEKQMYDEAAQILDEYEKIVPNDPDIQTLRDRTLFYQRRLYS